MVGERHVGRRWRSAAVARRLWRGCWACRGPPGGPEGAWCRRRAVQMRGPPVPAAGSGHAAPQDAAASPTPFSTPRCSTTVWRRPAGSAPTAAAGPLAGGLVPHHDLAAELLSGFFLCWRRRPPEVIFLVGPNHEAAGPPVITGRRLADRLRSVEADPERGGRPGGRRPRRGGGGGAVRGRHAMGTLMPYIKSTRRRRGSCRWCSTAASPCRRPGAAGRRPVRARLDPAGSWWLR